MTPVPCHVTSKQRIVDLAGGVRMEFVVVGPNAAKEDTSVNLSPQGLVVEDMGHFTARRGLMTLTEKI